MAREYKTTPSSLLSITDPHIAWCLNEATYIWGRHVEAEMDAAAAQHKEGAHKNAARQRVLQMLLQDPTVNDSGQSMKGKFRDPAELIGRGR